MVNNAEIRRVDDWELRCRFNHGRYYQRLQDGVFKPKILRSEDASPESGQPPGTKSQIVTYLDENDDDIAEIHQFVLPNGRIGAQGKQDPKHLREGGVMFRRFKGADHTTRDPSLLFPASVGGFWRKGYGWFRKFCCRTLGPEKDAKLAELLTPRLRKLFSASTAGAT